MGRNFFGNLQKGEIDSRYSLKFCKITYSKYKIVRKYAQELIVN